MKPARAKRTSPAGVTYSAEFALANDVVLPEQSEATRMPRWLRLLHAALIEDAVNLCTGKIDARRDHTCDVRRARMWLSAPGFGRISLRDCCAVLGWDWRAEVWAKIATGKRRRKSVA